MLITRYYTTSTLALGQLSFLNAYSVYCLSFLYNLAALNWNFLPQSHWSLLLYFCSLFCFSLYTLHVSHLFLLHISNQLHFIFSLFRSTSTMRAVIAVIQRGVAALATIVIQEKEH